MLLDCFLLTRQWRDVGQTLQLSFWAASSEGPVRIVIEGDRAVCFIERTQPEFPVGGMTRRHRDLKTLSGRPIDALYFNTQRGLVDFREERHREGARLFESDIKPSDRYLMERFITGGFCVSGEARRRPGVLEFVNPRLRRAQVRPALRSVSLDIETDGLDGELFSIAVHADAESRVFMVSTQPVAADGLAVECGIDERAVLEAFFAWLERFDPDLIIGWNIVNFDLDYLERKCAQLKVAFALGRGGERATILAAGQRGGSRVARLPGRVVLDGIDTLRAAFWRFESFALESVAQALLGRGKDIHDAGDKVAEIRRLFHQDKAALARYNLEDCRLVSDIFAASDLIPFSMRRAELTGLAMERQGGSVAAFDNLYLPRLHRRGKVAPDTSDAEPGPGSPGGYVMDSKPGLYENVLLLDFKSLYPSIIRTFKIDPLGLAEPGDDPVPGFLDATFAREGAILPDLIEELWQARDHAKSEHDAALSQAVKILMNSFYGVLGANGCRFFDARLASSITRRGQQIIVASRDYLEQRGHTVIYGDTDSVFVLVGPDRTPSEARALGDRLAAELNGWWTQHIRDEYRLKSYLEIEFETHYLRFLMPTVRGENTGSKKRYAGLVRSESGEPEVVFKGLESVRTDWTPLARRFQRELYRRIFLDEPYDDYIRDCLADMLDGKLDEELVYRKRLRRKLSEYTRNIPPHVQAARKLANPGRWIRYVITNHGPEPVAAHIPQPDYAHYRERQLAPAADGILHFLGESFAAMTDRQLEIF